MTKRKKVGLLNKIFVIWSGKGKRNPKKPIAKVLAC